MRAVFLGLSDAPFGVSITPDGRFAFVSLEDSGTEAVYNLRAAAASNFRTSGYIGSVPVGIAPVGLALLPNGHWLYATSEAGNAETVTGTLSVIRVATAEHDPAHAVVATAAAKCSPVRAAVSADGGTVWVTARGSDNDPTPPHGVSGVGPENSRRPPPQGHRQNGPSWDCLEGSVSCCAGSRTRSRHGSSC
jgi:DNA-binding beta-propeller fold protein YncE